MGWCRWWDDILPDRKLHTIAKAAGQPYTVAVGVWGLILAMANTSPIRGRLLISATVPYSLADLADVFRLPEDVTLKLFHRFMECEMLHQEGDTWVVSHWATRQYEHDKSTARVQRHRANKREGTGLQPQETVPETVPSPRLQPQETVPETCPDTEVQKVDDDDEGATLSDALEVDPMQPSPTRYPLCAEYFRRFGRAPTAKDRAEEEALTHQPGYSVQEALAAMDEVATRAKAADAAWQPMSLSYFSRAIVETTGGNGNGRHEANQRPGRARARQQQSDGFGM